MCHYVSFLVDKKGALYFGYLDSHAGIEAGHGLRPGDYREAEWTGDDENSLTVRVEDGEDASYYRSMILGDYPTRQDMIKTIKIGKTDSVIYHYRNGVPHCDDGPAVERASGSKAWYKNGKLHRDDGPAIEWADGSKAWYQNGKLKGRE